MISSRPKSEALQNEVLIATETSRLEIIEWTVDKQTEKKSAPNENLHAFEAGRTADIRPTALDFSTIVDTNQERCASKID